MIPPGPPFDDLEGPATEGVTGDLAVASNVAPSGSGLAPGSVLARRYRIERFVARGGMGEVYEAFDTALGVKVALKTIRAEAALAAEALERFKREVLLARGLAHPGLCRTYDLGQDDSSAPPLLFLTMELLVGESLWARLRRTGAMTAAEALPLIVQMAESLGAAHTAGVVHRDFKSANIFLEPVATGTRVVITDFGLALARGGTETGTEGLTVVGAILGTPAYMAPEQVRGQRAGPAADIYALGIVAYEMLSGQLPFSAETPLATAARRLYEEAPSLRSVVTGLEPSLVEAIARALKREPGERFATAPEFAAALLPRSAPSVAGARPVAAPRVASRALLLTDVVDSTKLVETLGEARIVEVWTAHDRAARDLLVAHGGLEIDRTDGFLVIFVTSAEGAAYAIEYHRALARLGTQLGLDLKARAGLHLGEVTLRENSADDVRRGAKPLEVEGLAKPLAARVMALARGGQTLLTEEARAALGGKLGEGAELVSHGHYRVKGIAAPVELHELGVRGESPFAPPEDAPKAYRVVREGELWRPVREVPHALPAERDAFVGRRNELFELAQKLDDGARLVTVLGPGGTGKTRLVVRYGSTWLGDWPGGVWFADLSETRGRDGIATALATALGVPLGKEDPVVQLGHAIAGRGRCLVVLDNFEQVRAHAEATLGSWLARAKEAAFVVTSREVLQVAGEAVLVLPPLSPEDEGTELFEVRARAHKPGFAPSAEGLREVRELVRLLDGMPLAIELAAARVRVLSPKQILERMKDRFQLLAGSRGVAARQSTLRAAIDWSWELLDPWEQAALAQLSVFAGAFGIEAVEAVLSLDAFPGAPWALDAVQALVDKSLLRSWHPAESARRLDIEEPYFGIYLSIHEYAAEKLRTLGAIAGTPGTAAASGPEAQRAAEVRHGAYFGRFGSDELLDALDGAGGAAKRRSLEIDLDNLMTAARRAAARGDGRTAADVFLAAWAVFELKGPFAAAVDLGSVVLTCEGLAPALRARVEGTLGRALQRAGKMEEARARFAAALAVHRDSGNRRFEGVVMGYLGILHLSQGRMSEARSHCEAALAIHREVHNRRHEGTVLGNLGIVDLEEGRLDEARVHYETAFSIHREVGNRREEGIMLGNLGVLHFNEGRLDEARAHLVAALVIHREVGNRRHEGYFLGNLGDLDLREGRMNEARVHLEKALAIHREVGDRRPEGEVLGNLGNLHFDEGRLDETRSHYETALAIHREVGNRRFEGLFAGQLGNLERRLGRHEEARAAYLTGDRLLREVGAPLDLGMLLCARGEHEHAVGDASTAATCLAEAESLALATGAGAHSDLGRALAKLQQALATG